MQAALQNTLITIAYKKLENAYLPNKNMIM